MLFKPLVSHVPEEDDDLVWTVSDTVYLSKQMTRFMRPWPKSVMLVWLQDTLLIAMEKG